MHINLSGKHALIGGASKGIGRAIAMEMAKAGASVTAIARDKDSLMELMSALSVDKGQKHNYLVADFSDPIGLRTTVEEYLRQSSPIDIIVNNSGGPPAGKASEASLESYVSAFTQHVLGSQTIVQLILPFMRSKSWGRIINVISTSVKQPIEGLGVSNTIRGAMGNWSKTLSRELAPFGITVNNVLPGATYTGRIQDIISGKAEKTGKSEDDVKDELLSEIPAGRFAQPEEIAYAAVFLASEQAAYITGTNVVVDGGRTGNL